MDYEIVYNRNRKRFEDRLHAQPVSFDFTRDYDEPVVVHHSWGGGQQSVEILAHLTISRLVADALTRRLSTIRSPYSAIHIRHTDYKTDFERSLYKVYPYLLPDVFIATDNYLALCHAKRVLASRNLIYFTNLPHRSQAPLHIHDGKRSIRSTNMDAIADLLMLSLAENYFAFKITGDPKDVPLFSGYSRLAFNVRRSGNLLRRLLGDYPMLNNELSRLAIRPVFPSLVGPSLSYDEILWS